jgi:hypothetical protein
MTVSRAEVIDPAAARAAQLQHLTWFAELDAGYARWRADQLQTECPEYFGGLLQDLDAALADCGIAVPEPFTEPASKVPALASGRRARRPRHFSADA